MNTETTTFPDLLTFRTTSEPHNYPQQRNFPNNHSTGLRQALELENSGRLLGTFEARYHGHRGTLLPETRNLFQISLFFTFPWVTTFSDPAGQATLNIV